jgi:hypothetical protein
MFGIARRVYASYYEAHVRRGPDATAPDAHPAGQASPRPQTTTGPPVVPVSGHLSVQTTVGIGGSARSAGSDDGDHAQLDGGREADLASGGGRPLRMVAAASPWAHVTASGR